MKRFFSFCIFFILVFSLITFTVSAEQVDYDIGLINLFDLQINYPTIVRDGTLYKTRFDFPSGYKNYHYFEFYYYCADANHTASIYRYDSFLANCTIVPCGNGYYKAYWSGSQGSSYINFVIDSSTSAITLASAYYSDVVLTQSSIPFSVAAFNFGDLNYSSSGTQIYQNSYPAGGVANLLSATTGLNEYCNFDNTAFISKSEWSKYDFLTLHYDFDRYSLGSVNVKIDNVSVPYSLSFNNNIDKSNHDAVSSHVGNSQLNIIIDVSNIPLTYNSSVAVNVTGTYFNASSATTFCYISDVRGFNKANEVDTDVVWYRRIYLGLESWFYDLSNKLSSLISGNTQQNQNADDFKDSVDDQASELESMTNVMNSVERPDINSINISSGSMVDSSSLVLATSGISSIMGNSIILRVILMGLTFGLIGFVLYGKKG